MLNDAPFKHQFARFNIPPHPAHIRHSPLLLIKAHASKKESHAQTTPHTKILKPNDALQHSIAQHRQSQAQLCNASTRQQPLGQALLSREQRCCSTQLHVCCSAHNCKLAVTCCARFLAMIGSQEYDCTPNDRLNSAAQTCLAAAYSRAVPAGAPLVHASRLVCRHRALLTWALGIPATSPLPHKVPLHISTLASSGGRS